MGEELHQEPDHPITFMKISNVRTRTMSAVNDERRQVLPSNIIWDKIIDRFEAFRNNVEGQNGQIGAGYLFDSSFQEADLDRGVDCYVNFWMKSLFIPISKRMLAHYMAHSLVHARVV
jgi:hypothetical protein